MSTLNGGCHCGNIKVVFETAIAPGALPLRACQCQFCQKHGARYASDPGGRLTITVADGALLLRYGFALGLTDFLSCRRCGVYVAATTKGVSDVRGVVNVNVLDEHDSLPGTAEPMLFDGESVAVRIARRLRGWTPVTMSVAASPTAKTLLP